MLPCFNEIFEKINKLMTIGINLLNQLVGIYSEENQDYKVAYKFYNFGLAFDYLGKILSYFLAIDTVVAGNNDLKEHWNRYRGIIYKLKSNPQEFGASDEQGKRLDKFVKKVNAPIFENTCYLQCVHIIQEKRGKNIPNNLY